MSGKERESPPCCDYRSWTYFSGWKYSGGGLGESARWPFGDSAITRFDASGFPSRFAGEVKGFDLSPYLSSKEARHMDTFIHYGLAAGIQAIHDSGIEVNVENAHRIGVIAGSGIGGLPLIEETHAGLLQRGPRRISPFFV